MGSDTNGSGPVRYDVSDGRAGHGRPNSDHPLLAAVYDACMWGFERTVLPAHRNELARGLSGRVLDLGSGTGTMFPRYRAAAEGAALELFGVEPDPHMRRRAERVAAGLDLDVDLYDAPAEALPFGDGSFDVVVGALVFCTVDDPGAALDEVARVLRPGGEFRSLEHVADEGWRRRVQTVLTPVWTRFLFAGCHLDRDTPALFESHDGFDVVELAGAERPSPPSAC